MTVIGVDSPVLGDTAGFLREKATTITGAVQQLDTRIAGMAGFWRGPAAATFVSGWSEVRDGAVGVLAALEEIADLMREQGAEFDTLDEQLADTLSALPPASSLRL